MLVISAIPQEGDTKYGGEFSIPSNADKEESDTQNNN